VIPIKDVIRPRAAPLAALSLLVAGTLEFGVESWMSCDVRESWLGVAVNAAAIWIFADNVEDRLGPVRFVAVYAICTAIGLAAFALVESWVLLPMLLSTGGTAGLLGLYLAWYPRSRVLTFFPFPPDLHEVPAILFLPFFTVLHAPGGLAGLTEALAGFLAGAALSAVVSRPVEW
jgi:membrane associated rhomboid family serine protease